MSALGKTSRQGTSDIVITWIIQAYREFIENKDMNIVLVPVMVSYDRLFEANYVAEGVFDGTKHPESSITQLSRKVLMPQANSLGNVFVKYLEPIQLKEYMQKEASLNIE